MTSYSNKSNALRAAKKASFENPVAYESEGRWYVSDAAEVVAPVADAFEATVEELAAQTIRPVAEETHAEQRARIAATEYDLVNVPFDGVEQDPAYNNQGHCPCCGIHLSNGAATYNDICETNKKAAGQMVMEYTCLGCGGEWGPVIERKARSTKPVKHNGNTIDKVRETKNGQTRPSANTLGGKLWAIFDQQIATTGECPTRSWVLATAEANGFNLNMASCLLSHFRKFNGFTK